MLKYGTRKVANTTDLSSFHTGVSLMINRALPIDCCGWQPVRSSPSDGKTFPIERSWVQITDIFNLSVLKAQSLSSNLNNLFSTLVIIFGLVSCTGQRS